MVKSQLLAELGPRGFRDDDRAEFPCSQSQKRFWFETQLDPDNAGLNVAVRWRLEGNVAHAHLEEAWRLIIARQQTLRTAFATIDGEPRQVVEPEVEFHIPLVDLTAMSDDAAAAEAERLASVEAKTTFDITKAPLIRVTHIRVRPDSSMILVTTHHTVCDGWSVGLLAAEMGEICAALGEDRAPVLPELSVTYADYVERESEWLAAAGEAHREELAQRWSDFEQFEVLPDKTRPSIQTSNGEILSTLLPRDLTAEIAELARKNRCTLFMVAYAALLALLNRYSLQTDITIGTQFAGRDEVEFEPLVGTFVNTVALRTDVSGDPTFAELLERARDTVTDAYELRYVPLEELIEIVNPKRDLSRNALFSINFIFQRSFIKNETYGKFKLVDLPSRSAGSICDLNFFMVERPEGWRASCEFNTDLYRRETVDRMLQRWKMILREIARDSSAPISALLPLNDREPKAVPAISEGEATAAELERRSNQLARFLKAAGVGPAMSVGVALEHSPSVPAALLAILKTGASYVPLDLSYSRERLSSIVRDAGISLIISERVVRERVPDNVPIVDLTEAATAIAAQSESTLDEHRLGGNGATVAPHAVVPSATEKRLSALVSELLKVKHIDRDADIFGLGFHSLLAMRFTARVKDTLGIELPVRIVFENPTIAALAARIDNSLSYDDRRANPILTLNAGGTRPPFIYFHSDLFADGLHSRQLAAALGPDQPVHAIAPHGTAGLALLPTIELMALDYASLIRKVQPKGPYRVGGYCASGLVAYELARLLREQGEVVERLVLLNSSPMPTRSIRLFDTLIRRVGLNQRLAPSLRDRLCYNLARLHAAVLMGPWVTSGFVFKTLRTFLRGRSQAIADESEARPFEKRLGLVETENSFAHIVASFTYHPKPHDGDATLIWSEDQETTFDDPTQGWGAVLSRVTVEAISGGHVGAINEHIDELARLLKKVFGDRTNEQ